MDTQLLEQKLEDEGISKNGVVLSCRRYDAGRVIALGMQELMAKNKRITLRDVIDTGKEALKREEGR